MDGVIDRGIGGPIDPQGSDPVAIWATAVTGASPLRHGIHGAFTVRPDGAGIQPFGADDWQTPPLWQRLADAGWRVATVNAPGTTPATAWPGLVVDDRFATMPVPGQGDWPLPPGCVQPARLREVLRPHRLHPDELDEEVCAGLPPPALAEAISIQAAALHLLEHETPDVLVVVHTLPARTSATAAGRDDALAFTDTLLGHLIAAAGPDADILVTNPTGFLVASGPFFRVDELRHDLCHADIAATVLARFGIRAELGRSLATTQEGPLRSTARLPRAPRLPPPPPPDTADARRAVEIVTVQQSRGIATALLGAGEYAAAADALQPALALRPHDPDLLLLLGQCRFFVGDWAACETVGLALDAAAPALPWGPMLRGAAKAGADDSIAAGPLLALAALRAVGNKPALHHLGAIALALGNPALARQHYGAAHALPPPDAGSLAGLGLTHLALGDAPAGEALLRQSLALRFQAPAIHHQLGLLYAQQRRWREADAALTIALSQQPDLRDAASLQQRVRRAIRKIVEPTGRV